MFTRDEYFAIKTLANMYLRQSDYYIDNKVVYDNYTKYAFPSVESYSRFRNDIQKALKKMKVETSNAHSW